MHSKPKQVIVIRRDLKMQRGKEIAQGAHAAMAWLANRVILAEYGPIAVTKVEIEWIEGNFAKVCVQVDTEKELLELKEKASAAGIMSNLITDSGLTVFHGVPTVTCLAIGPDYPEKIDPITGHLKLY